MPADATLLRNPLHTAVDKGDAGRIQAPVDKMSTGAYFPQRASNDMHVISRKPFADAARVHPNDAGALDRTYRVLRSGEFNTPEALRQVFPSLDNFKYKDKWWVLNIGGNNLRLIALIEFRCGRMYIKHITSHAEYDKLCKRYANGR
jgi:mRNA interferase HigB